MKSENERHDRLMRQPPLLRAGFRPFFLGGAVWAIVVLTLWILAFSGRIALPTAFAPLAWHRHEMLFGYLTAVVAGFLLTAIPNWTGRLPVSGKALAALAALWLAARLAVLFSAIVGTYVAAALDIGFLAALAFVAGREIAIARNNNLPIVVALGLLTVADGLDHAELLGLASLDGAGWRLGFAVVLLLVSLVGGRIIPSFTRNWLTKQGRTQSLPSQPGRFDHVTVGFSAIGLLAWTIAPESGVSASLLIVAGMLHLARLARWSGWRTWREPLVLILHISYAWLPIGLLLLGGSHFVWCIPRSSALHALSAGAMASMTLAVMTRVTLGHTGRELRTDGWAKAIYLMLSAGALLRVAAPMLPLDYVLIVAVAALLWGGAFVAYMAGFAPKLIGPRPDGRP